MGLLDKLTQGRTRRGKGSGRKSKRSRGKQRKSAHEALPGGASADEAAKANPQRAAELAD